MGIRSRWALKDNLQILCDLIGWKIDTYKTSDLDKYSVYHGPAGSDIPISLLTLAERADTPQLVLNHVVAIVHLVVFANALDRYKIDLNVSGQTKTQFQDKFQELIQKGEILDFKEKDLEESQLYKDYYFLFYDLLNELDLSSGQKVRVYNYHNDNYGAKFWRLITEYKGGLSRKIEGFLQGEQLQARIRNLSRERYLVDLKNQYTEITLNDEKGLTLNHIYQEPNYSIFKKCLLDEAHKNIAKDKVFVNPKLIHLANNVHSFVLSWLRSSTKLSKLKNAKARILLLYGYPGQGKTSFCKRLVYDLLRAQDFAKPLFMLRLRELSEPIKLKSEVLATISHHLNEEYQLETSKNSLKSSLLILDGLDELLMKNKLQNNDIEDIFRAIVDEVERYKDLKIIITSRYGYLNLERLPANDLLIARLDEFELEQQLNWLKAYQTFYPKVWLTKEKITEIRENGGFIDELIRQPILLHMIASLDQDFVEGVGNRAGVYSALFDQITNPVRWKDAQIKILKGLDTEDLRGTLREAAFHIFQSGEGYIHKTGLEKLPAVLELREKLQKQDSYFREALKMMMVAFYFQERPKSRRLRSDDEDYDYAIEFLHKSLQEYLTAEYIWETVKGELIDKNRKKKYIKESEAEILEFLQEIFGKQPMSLEVANYLVEIIENDKNDEEKQELAKRLEYVIDYGLQKQFVYTFDAEKQDSVMDLSNWIFYGYWTIYAHLKEKIDLFGEGKEERRGSIVSILQFFQYKKTALKPLRLVGADLRVADLRVAYLRDAYLSGAYLSVANLRGADLRVADLSGANLSVANLSGADLRGGDLRGADLSHAYLSGAYLRDADLSGADLNVADLSGAYLRRADLSGADLRGADLSRADLRRADLNGVRNATIKQLASARSLEGARGLPSKWMVKLRKLMGS